MQLDVFLPNFVLALEYQGEQHFQDIYRFSKQEEYAARDQQKRKACLEAGITLIEIPYWWDYEEDSLRATIHSHRPDLISPGNGAPIADSPKSRIF
jgi:hypothetical protein